MELVVSAPPALAFRLGPAGQFEWSRCRTRVSDPPRSLDARGLFNNNDGVGGSPCHRSEQGMCSPAGWGPCVPSSSNMTQFDELRRSACLLIDVDARDRGAAHRLMSTRVMSASR